VRDDVSHRAPLQQSQRHDGSRGVGFSSVTTDLLNLTVSHRAPALSADVVGGNESAAGAEPRRAPAVPQDSASALSRPVQGDGAVRYRELDSLVDLLG